MSKVSFMPFDLNELAEALESGKSVMIKGRIVSKTENIIEIEGQLGLVTERFRFEKKGKDVWLIRVTGGENITVRRWDGLLPHVEVGKDSLVIRPNGYLLSYESLINNDNNNDNKRMRNNPSYPTDQPDERGMNPRYKPYPNKYRDVDDEEEEKR